MDTGDVFRLGCQGASERGMQGLVLLKLLARRER
jgi:hypothetical protein